MTPLEALQLKADLSDAVLFADRAEAALQQGLHEDAKRLILEAMLRLNKASLYHWGLDGRPPQYEAAYEHVQRIARLTI